MTLTLLVRALLSQQASGTALYTVCTSSQQLPLSLSAPSHSQAQTPQAPTQFSLDVSIIHLPALTSSYQGQC